MNFSAPKLEPRITKDFLLSKNSEETYMSTYLGIPVKRGLQISPLRRDKKPTAGFYRNKKGELIFHDFGIGFNENFIGVVMYLNHCTYQRALNIIAEDFGYIERSKNREPVKLKITTEKIEEKSDTLIQIEKQNFTPAELKWWESFGITERTLKKFNVHSCKSLFLNGSYFKSSTDRSFIFGYYGGKKNGSELWRIYFPLNRSFRFISNWGKNLIQGAKQLPLNGDLLVITKSMKDCMVLYEMGISAIAPCSEVLFLSDAQLDRLKQRFKKIIVFYDNDLPGIAGMNRIKKAHPELSYFFIPRRFEAKDVSDFVKKYGIKKTKEYIKQIENYFEEREILNS
jgi:DNA primase